MRPGPRELSSGLSNISDTLKEWLTIIIWSNFNEISLFVLFIDFPCKFLLFWILNICLFHRVILKKCKSSSSFLFYTWGLFYYLWRSCNWLLLLLYCRICGLSCSYMYRWTTFKSFLDLHYWWWHNALLFACRNYQLVITTISIRNACFVLILWDLNICNFRFLDINFFFVSFYVVIYIE